MEQKGSIYQRLPPYYGWIIFLITLLTYMIMYGLRYSIGVFFTPMQSEFGWSAAVTASAVTVFFWMYGVSAPFMGMLAEKIGVRKTVALGGLLLGSGGASVSLARELWQLYLFWGVIAAVGAAALYVIPTMVLSRFFEKKRGKAVGWASIGISLGQAVLVPFAASLTIKYGWRMAILTLGIMVLIVASFIGYVFLRETPESIGLKIDGGRLEPSKNVPQKNATLEASPPSPVTETEDWTPREALSSGSFRFIILSYFFMAGGVISLLTFVVPHMIRIGIDPLKAGGAFGAIGAMSAAGSFLFGILSDKLGRKPTITITTFGIAISLFVAALIPANLILLYAWAVLYGLAYGGCPEQYAAITADYFGRKHGTTLLGFLTFGGSLGGGLFPLIGGYIVDMTGGYYTTLLFLGTCMSMATLSILPAKPVKKTHNIKT